MLELPPSPPNPPRSLTGAFHELLVQPLAGLERARQGRGAAPLRLLAGSVLGYALYGAAAGFFQGGEQILVSAIKAPLIILFALLLCVPSLYVFSAVAGADWTRDTFLSVFSGFAATLALVLLALLPINWLFSVSSRYLASTVFLQFGLWVLALLLAWRFLGRALQVSGAAAGGLFFWLLLFALVSIQSATLLRPVLERRPGDSLFVQGKKSFMDHLDDVYRADSRRDKDAREAEEAARKKAEAAKKSPNATQK